MHYFTANNLIRDLHMAGEALVLPATVLAETCYWLNEHGGAEVEAVFLDAVADGTLQLVGERGETVIGELRCRRLMERSDSGATTTHP